MLKDISICLGYLMPKAAMYKNNNRTIKSIAWVLWGSYLSQSCESKSERNNVWIQFLPVSSRVDTAVWMHHLDASKTAGEEARRNYTRMLRAILNKS